MPCPKCHAEVDPAVGVCSQCGTPMGVSLGNEPSWRQQVRETVQRRKEMRHRQLSKREEDARQLSIFPEEAATEAPSEEDSLRRRHAEIRERVEKKLGKPKQKVPTPFEAGEVTIPVGSASALAATVADLDVSSERGFDTVTEELAEPEQAGEAGLFEAASPGERILAGLMDLGFVSLLFLTILYLTARMAGRGLGFLPGASLAAVFVMSGLLVVGYFLFFWALSGQTFGGLLVGSRVIGAEGAPLGLKRAFLRGVGVVLSLLPLGLGFVGLWTDAERRGWHDRIASSKVVRA